MKRTVRETGFTLIELLVVVAILTVLMALLIPSLMKARERSKVVVCQVNARSIGQLLAMYVGE